MYTTTEPGSLQGLGEKEAEGPGASLYGFNFRNQVNVLQVQKANQHGDSHKTKRQLK